MTALPDRVRVTFPEISSRAWEHPADRTSLVTLRTLQGFDVLLKALSGLLHERAHRLLYLSTAVRVDQRQFPAVDRLRADCVTVLDSPTTPELYVVQNPFAEAVTIGMDKPFIVLTSGLLELMDEEELRFVIGHELGHAMSGHAVYRTILMHLLRLADSLGWLPIGGWALRAIVAALMEWQRKSELSGDRAGLLCGQDEDAAIRVQLKLAGGKNLAEMDVDAFVAQAAEYESTGDLRDGVLKLLNLERQSHPFSVLRAAALRSWVAGGEYTRILEGAYPRRGDDADASVGDEMRGAGRTYRENFDQSKDPLIKTLRDVGGNVGAAADTVGQNIGDFANDLGRRFANWRATPPAPPSDPPPTPPSDPPSE